MNLLQDQMSIFRQYEFIATVSTKDLLTVSLFFAVFRLEWAENNLQQETLQFDIHLDSC
jgi:hypothetical protein